MPRKTASFPAEYHAAYGLLKQHFEASPHLPYKFGPFPAFKAAERFRFLMYGLRTSYIDSGENQTQYPQRWLESLTFVIRPKQNENFSNLPFHVEVTIGLPAEEGLNDALANIMNASANMQASPGLVPAEQSGAEHTQPEEDEASSGQQALENLGYTINKQGSK